MSTQAQWIVDVEVDAKGGDDDVFEVRCTVRADDETAARMGAEMACAKQYGAENVLGAYAAARVSQ